MLRARPVSRVWTACQVADNAVVSVDFGKLAVRKALPSPESLTKLSSIRCLLIALLTISLLLFAVSKPAQASEGIRSLKIFFVNTGEKANIAYKRDGVFDPQGLRQLSLILRDWRKNQPTRMNRRLFDLLWQVYRESGSTGYIYVICGFRSAGTNEMLRMRVANSGVAKESQHTLGNAIDFFIPGVKLERLREIGLKLQDGGVGFYPTSGLPFVHMDVGDVRAWPRLRRRELVAMFPDGDTMHIPTDGKRLPEYDRALADYKRRLAYEQGLMPQLTRPSPLDPFVHKPEGAANLPVWAYVRPTMNAEAQGALIGALPESVRARAALGGSGFAAYTPRPDMSRFSSSSSRYAALFNRIDPVP